MAQAEESQNRAKTQELVSIQMNNLSTDLLQRLVSRTHFSEKLEEEEYAEAEEEIELSLGLSLNGRFGVDPRAKNDTNNSSIALKRSSSISDFTTSNTSPGSSACHVAPACHVALARTCSLPTETEAEWRRRKELQSLRRMEAKRKRSEKQRNSRAVKTSIAGGGGEVEQLNNGDKNDNGLPPQAASFQGSTGSHGSGSSGTSESDSQACQGHGGVPKYPETRSPTIVQSTQESEQKLGTLTRLTSSDFNGLAAENQSSKPAFAENGTKEVARNVLEDMPCVSTTGLGPNGKRIEGFLYRYRKGEEVRIVCVCHGSFLSPAEFVKHAGGVDVAHPLKHIVVNPTPFL